MSKTNKSLYGRKKTTRNILIAAAVAVVLVLAIVLFIALSKDTAGMNCFQRQSTVASADGVKASMAEYRVTFDSLLQNSETSDLNEAQIRNAQEYAAKQVLLQKIYTKEAKALGLTLTKEQQDAAKKSAQDRIDSLEKAYREYMVANGSYSKTAFEKQMAEIYDRIGMNENEYYAFLKETAESGYYSQLLSAYYAENGNGFDEDTLLAYYRKTVEAGMYKENEDGSKTVNYTDGQYWNTMLYYAMGSSDPMMYLPEGFILVDFIELEMDSKEEIEAVLQKIESGEMSFDELQKSDDNKDMFRGAVNGPYPIAEKDHALLFDSDEAYAVAAALEIGGIGSYIVEPETSETAPAAEGEGGTTEETAAADSTESAKVTAYLFRRADASEVFMEGDSGVVNINYYSGLHDAFVEEYRAGQWFADLKFEDALYTYKGVLG